MKRCIYCGETKDDEQFRPYYNRPTGRYTFCRSCERIEARRKYLCRKKTRTAADDAELSTINQLYDARRAAGLQSPGQTRIKPMTATSDIVREELRRLGK